MNSTVPSDVEIAGDCGSKSEKLSLQWVDKNMTLTLVMWFNKTSDDYSMATVKFLAVGGELCYRIYISIVCSM